ncbi:MAG TPA: CAP domain-containing protein [Acidimicrobiales bacterium]|nr:CAP domain-containing protein [Acidimicrobiales bacterium]
MRLRVVLAAAVLAFSIAFVPFARPAAAADPSAEQQFIDLINAERTARGLNPLALRPEVIPVARAWTLVLITNQALSHNPLLSSLMPSDWTRIGENVGYGPNVSVLHNAFMNSPGHRANVLGDFNQIGVGVDRDLNGVMWVTVDFMKTNQPVASVTGPVASLASSPGACAPNVNPPNTGGGATGYYVLGSDGAIFSYGNAAYKGSVPALGLRITAVLMTLTPSQEGYWIAGNDGGIFSFGDAVFHGSVPGLNLGVPVTAIDLKPTATGRGYWILGNDGGIFSFGDAEFYGSLPGIGVRNRAVRLVPTATGRGYWILGADGGIFSFGDAQFFGSVPGLGLRATGVSMARTASGNGYYVLGSDGGIFSFGDAAFHGSVPGLGLCESVNGVQLSRSVGGNGYYIVSDRGRVFSFGDAPFLGEPAATGAITRDVAAVRR